MTFKSWISWLDIALTAVALIVSPSIPAVHAIGDARMVNSRFESGPINVQYNSKKGGGCFLASCLVLLIFRRAMIISSAVRLYARLPTRPYPCNREVDAAQTAGARLSLFRG